MLFEVTPSFIFVQRSLLFIVKVISEELKPQKVTATKKMLKKNF